MTSSTTPKNALIYLRVSSDKQVKKDYDDEGLSIPAQRQACIRKAESLGADVIAEFVDPGVSGGSVRKRKAFRAMLELIEERGDIDYVVVWSVSRWARDQEDHWITRGMLRRAGTSLVSVKEQIGGESSSDIMLEGVLAAVAASRRIEIAEDVRRGVVRKAEVGGTPYRAPLGYVNVRHIEDGREIRDIELDPERAEHVQECFTLYATGDYTLGELAAIMEARGLRIRPTKRVTAKPLGVNRLSSMLRNTYYLGIVTVGGNTYKGRHEPLVDEQTFETVQQLLASRRHRGSKSSVHHHYLAGTLACAACGQRLVYSRNRGRNGTYHEYYRCLGRPTGDCQQPYHRVDAIEAAIAEHYGQIELATSEREQIEAEGRSKLEHVSADGAQAVRDAETQVARLATQEKKLLDAHYKDVISPELFAEETRRIRRERTASHNLIARFAADYDLAAANLEAVLTLTHDLRLGYLQASDAVRRQFNRAIFYAIYIDNESVAGSELLSPYSELVALTQHQRPGGAWPEPRQPLTQLERWKGPGAGQPPALAGVWTGPFAPQNDKNPRPHNGDTGSNMGLMVPPRGIEPLLQA